MNKNKAIVIEWFDDVNPDSYVLIPFHYGVKILQSTPIDDDRTEVVFYGPAENVDKLTEDFEEGDVEPLESMQSGDYDEEDYEAWLNNEVNIILDLMDEADRPEFTAPVVKF